MQIRRLFHSWEAAIAMAAVYGLGFTQTAIDAKKSVSQKPVKTGQSQSSQKDIMWNRLLTQWDANGDGQLDGTEWKGRLPFDQLDADKNGSITREEWNAFSPGKRPTPDQSKPSQSSSSAPSSPEDFFNRLAQAMDTNRNGWISREEWKGRSELFNPLDFNKDGVLSADDFNSITDYYDQALDDFERYLRDQDADHDGKISRDEYKGMPDLWGTQLTFEQVDLNGDGFITGQEYGVAGSIQHAGATPSKTDILFKILDTDDDMKISAQEWPWNLRSFQCIDGNGDGFIVQQEIAK